MTAATLAPDPLVARLRELVAPDVAGEDAAHDLAHLDRVARVGRTLALAEGADPLVVELAAYCHDFHRVLERRAGHAAPIAPAACEALVRDALAGSGAPDALVAPVLACIEASDRHGFAGEDLAGASREGLVLHDADGLDAMGAVGIARAFTFGALLGEPLWAPEVPQDERYRRGKSSSVIHHFHEKLLHLRDDMRTPSGRALAEERHATLERFLADFTREWAGGS